MKFCSKCGNQLPENVNFCSNCGNVMNGEFKKKGKATASMVLGIIAVSWAFLSILSIDQLGDEIVKYSEIAEYIGFIIGYNFLSLPCGIIGLSLGLSDKEKSSKKTAGIITSTISLMVVAISIIVAIIALV